jgi:hypothetical protein
MKLLPPADAYRGACHSGVEDAVAGALPLPVAGGAAAAVSTVLLLLLLGSALAGAPPAPRLVLVLVGAAAPAAAGWLERMPQLVAGSVLVAVDMVLTVSVAVVDRMGLLLLLAADGLLPASINRSIDRSMDAPRNRACLLCACCCWCSRCC